MISCRRAAGYAALVALVMGIPTVLIPNPVFSRLIPPTWWSYPMWLTTAVLAGLVLAGRDVAGGACRVDRPAATGGGLAFLAVACPTCNLVVMTTLGMSGALSIFAPLQPLLGIAGIAVLTVTLVRMLRTLRARVAEPGQLTGLYRAGTRTTAASRSE